MKTAKKCFKLANSGRLPQWYQSGFDAAPISGNSPHSIALILPLSPLACQARIKSLPTSAQLLALSYPLAQGYSGALIPFPFFENHRSFQKPAVSPGFLMVSWKGPKNGEIPLEVWVTSRQTLKEPMLDPAAVFLVSLPRTRFLAWFSRRNGLRPGDLPEIVPKECNRRIGWNQRNRPLLAEASLRLTPTANARGPECLGIMIFSEDPKTYCKCLIPATHSVRFQKIHFPHGPALQSLGDSSLKRIDPNSQICVSAHLVAIHMPNGSSPHVQRQTYCPFPKTCRCQGMPQYCINQSCSSQYAWYVLVIVTSS